MKSTLTFLITCLTVLCACHHDDPKPERAGRVVLVYMAAENNLNAQSFGDLSEMMEGSNQISKNDKLLVFVDKKNLNPYILKMENGDTVRMKTFKENLVTADPATLRVALQWMLDKYQADSYALVLWGHADGWTIKNDESQLKQSPRHAYGVDMAEGEQWMDITDMAKVLADFPHLTYIFADCCAFLSIESAYELRNVTDYIIASPAEIPAEGAPYHLVVPALFSREDNFYEQIADAYFMQTTYDGYKEPISVVKTNEGELENLAQATKTVLNSFVHDLPNRPYPDVSGLIYYYSHTLFDMNDFILRYASDDEYKAWKQAFDKAVIYKTFVPKWRANYVKFYDFKVTEERFGGVNMYVAQDPKTITRNNKAQQQAKTISRTQWYEAAGYEALGW